LDNDSIETESGKPAVENAKKVMGEVKKVKE